MAPPALAPATSNDSASSKYNPNCDSIIELHSKKNSFQLSFPEIVQLSSYLANSNLTGEDVCGILGSESNTYCDFIIEAHGKDPLHRSFNEIGELNWYLAGEDVCGILGSEQPDAAQTVRGFGTLDSGSIEKAKQVLGPNS